MISKTNGFALSGLNGISVLIEVDINNGLPAFEIVGLGDTAVKEAKERVRSAVKNSGRIFPTKRITANFAPADVRKEGSGFDLALAIGILVASGQLNQPEEGVVFIGELSLDGSLRRVNGILPILISALSMGYKTFVIPEGNKTEASFVDGVVVYTAKNLTEVIDHVSGLNILPTAPKYSSPNTISNPEYTSDMSLIKGQSTAKRALEIAVSGGHNILFVGAPGTGKTMLAKCIPTIMPDMSFAEALETTKIHSVAGLVKDSEGIVVTRPFRSPHHTATTASLTGGGSSVRPGEISLAHNGVLFLDEMPEYSRSTLEALRQPLEDGVITVSRVSGSVTYPANFMLCGSMNPCPCGNYGSSEKECTCSPHQIARYKSKISGPLLDRIDLQVTVDEVKYTELVSNERAETSLEIKKRVNRTRLVQKERYKNDSILRNADMGEKHIAKYCKLTKECEEILRKAYETFHLSPRARSRIIKVARTIADMELYDEIRPEHILEAVSYRHG